MERLPGLHIEGITLCPNDTAVRHGLRSFPVTAFRFPDYAAIDGASSEHSTARHSARSWKGRLAQHPRLYRAIKLTSLPVRSAAALIRLVSSDVSHTFRAARYLRGCRAVLVAGGGQLDDYWGGAWGHPYSLMKWAILSRLVGARFLVLSVGLCALDTRLGRLFSRIALRLADYRSFRESDTRDFCARLTGILGDSVVPDLAFGYPERTGARRVTSNRPCHVGIGPIVYLSPNHWPEPDASAYDRYLKSLVASVEAALGHGSRVTVFKSCSADWPAVDDLLAQLPPHMKADSRIRVVETRTVHDLVTLLDDLDVVIASRLHGVLLSHMAGKPAIAVSYDRKVDLHMRDMGETEHLVPFRAVEPDTLSASLLRLIERRVEVAQRVSTRSAACTTAVLDQFDLLQRLIQGDVAPVTQMETSA
jgi:polysaccharide pyruvyl transferase WcaK-like protein